MGSSSGTIGGRGFGSIQSAWLIGKPDDSSQTRVVHLFDRPVRCLEISEVGWDATIADATQVLEIKIIGLVPSSYAIAADGRPGRGQADVNYTLTAKGGAASEVSARSGQVNIVTLSDGMSASGAFELAFPSGNLAGDFRAEYCANGREP